MVDELKHYGMPRRSGRYPWGSGQDPYQRSVDWRAHIKQLKDQGMTDVEIAQYEGIKTTQLRARMALSKAEKFSGDRSQALKLKDKGYSNMEIGRRMNINESSVRNLLDPALAERSEIARITANMLKQSVEEKRYVDVGVGVESHIGVSRVKLNNALAELQEQGYQIHTVKVRQAGMQDQFTVMKVLGAPDTEWKELVNNIDLIKTVTAYSDDFGRTFNLQPAFDATKIKSVDSKRVKIIYAEDGGTDKDGVMELRRGVEDLDLGGSQYAQVRIGVDGTHFIKGMAIYRDDMPDGVDIIFNTNKSKDTPMLGPKNKTVLKPMKKPEGEEEVDIDNPFGATIKRQNGALNIVNEEGDWSKWSKTISSQVLSKQTVPVAKMQLNLALKQKQEEYEEIMALTNPVVKKQLLMAFADDCDSSAVHLKAAALPRQASKVILPIPGLKDTEVYAPTFKPGEIVVLIRHPHGGTFEIPQLTVNNKSKEAQAIMKNAPDAIGINPKVARKLSGADFDGDTVIVIPNNKGHIITSASLKALANFDPIERYRIPEGSKIKPMTEHTKGVKMGEVSNLITDMTIKGATIDELSRAVRHSMVVIDAEKHNLDYRQSAIDNGISALSARYQNSARGGASTLISRASSTIRPNEFKPRSAKDGGPIDPATGKKVYVPTNETYIDEKGRLKYRTTKTTKMAYTEDATLLSSGRPIEEVYATYANSLKQLGNDSRKNALSIIPKPSNPSAKKAYANEVKKLNADLEIALRNKPIERQAQILANSTVKRKKQAYPDMDADDLKKVRNQALADARARTGAKKTQIEISPQQWTAIQAGAISPSKLSQILQNTNLDRVKQLATPRSTVLMSPTKTERAKLMLAGGATQADVAEALGVSTSTLMRSMDEPKS